MLDIFLVHSQHLPVVHDDLGERRPDPGIDNYLNHSVEPVARGDHRLDEGGGPGLDHLQDAEFRGQLAVFFSKVALSAPDPFQPFHQGRILGAAPDQGLGHMDVTVDQARQNDAAFRVIPLVIRKVPPNLFPLAHCDDIDTGLLKAYVRSFAHIK